MRPALAVFCLLLFFETSVVGQTVAEGRDPYRGRFVDRLVFGGNIGLSFGDITYVSLDPLIGYRVTESFIAGIGLRYQYFRDNFYRYSTSIYGGSVFGRYYVYRGIFLESALEANNLHDYNPVTRTLERIWVPSLLVGGGYSSSIGGRAGFYASILYDILQDPNSPYYRQPVVRLGIGVGL